MERERFGAPEPKFEKTGDNEAGYPVYERVCEPGDLTEAQKVDLSTALQNISSPNVPKKNLNFLPGD